MDELLKMAQELTNNAQAEMKIAQALARYAGRQKAKEPVEGCIINGIEVDFRNIDNLSVFMGVAAEGEKMKPPIYQDGSFRQLKYCLEYRFRFNGESHSVYGKTQEECFQKRHDIETGKTMPKNALTLSKWLNKWVNTYKKPKITIESLEAINRNIKRISDKLGSIQLCQLKTEQIQEFLNNEPKNNTRIKLASVFSDSLQKAFATQKIKHNPYLAVEYRREKSKSYPVLQPDEQLKVYNAVSDKKYKDLFKISICTGMRISELIGLKVNDIDFKNNIITVKQQLDRNNRVKEKLKTDAAYRRIDFLPELFDGIDLSNAYLFQGISYVAVRSYFRRLFEKLELKFVLHSFRHTFISNCYYVGIRDKQIQQWAGHSKIEVTLNTYTHILKGKSPFIDYVKRLNSTHNSTHN